MGKPRTYEPGEWNKVVEAAGFDYRACGSYFMVMVGKQFAPDALDVGLPRSGRVSISELAREIEKAKTHRELAEPGPA